MCHKNGWQRGLLFSVEPYLKQICQTFHKVSVQILSPTTLSIMNDSIQHKGLIFDKLQKLNLAK